MPDLIPIGRKREKGMTMVELIAVAAIAAMAFTGSLYIRSQQQVDVVRDASGHAMRNIGIAVENYVAKFAYEIREGTLPVAGVADPARPTVQELVNIGFLPTGFDPSVIPGGQMLTFIERIPAGCMVEDCDLGWMTHTVQPLTRPGTGAADEASAGRLVRMIGAMAGYSKVTTPDFFNGFNDSWGAGIVNPTGQAGIIAIRGGYGSSMMAKFLRTDGGNQMAANIRAGGHSLVDVENATLTGDLAVGGDTDLKRKLVVGTRIKPSADPASGNAVSGAICNEASGSLRNDVNGNLLICRGGKWVNALDGTGFSAAISGCDRYVYGPVGAVIEITATDASDVNGLMNAGVYGQQITLDSTGVFTFTAEDAGSQVGYIQVHSGGRPVTGVATSCSAAPAA